MRVVVKIGTSSITTSEGSINSAAVSALCEEVALLRNLNHEVLIVTSGAVAGGVAALKLSKRPTDMPTLQALAAAGQSRLMQEYNVQLDRHQLVGAQVLLVPNDFIDRNQYLHARQTLLRLLELGCIPVINENDAIASDEIRFGDNDRIAALVAHSVSADVLILLTDLKGLYTADPNVDPNAVFVETVNADDELLSVRAGNSASRVGSGGMVSKLAAARIASWSGVRTVIAAALRKNVVIDAVNQAPGAGTQFLPRQRELSARKLWIAFAAQATGSVTVDDGARDAVLRRNVSLLHAGVKFVTGDFEAGDTIEVMDSAGHVIARGMTSVSSVQASAGAGQKSADLSDGVSAEVIHRDDLVVLAS
ncbi:MAG: glutamate 5-kinase [Actinobacteria bacterium]|nr:glutamate 5-kinase [Actinomycetota bacterium]